MIHDDAGKFKDDEMVINAEIEFDVFHFKVMEMSTIEDHCNLELKVDDKDLELKDDDKDLELEDDDKDLEFEDDDKDLEPNKCVQRFHFFHKMIRPTGDRDQMDRSDGFTAVREPGEK